MIKASLEKKDFDTFLLIINEADKLGQLSGNSIGNMIEEYLQQKDEENALKLFRIGIEKNLDLPISSCQSLLSRLVNYCNWFEAATMAEYMIQKSYMFNDREIFFICGGLMGSSEGVSKIFDIISVIANHRRDDLAAKFNFSKSVKFSRSVAARSAEGVSLLSSVSEETVQRALGCLLRAAQEHHWFSFSLYKMSVSLACLAGHESAAISFARHCVALTAQRPGGQSDLLSLLRGFSQGAGLLDRPQRDGPLLAPADALSQSHRLSQALLELLVDNLESAGLRDGPLRCGDLLTLYWSLAHLASHRDRSEQRLVPADTQRALGGLRDLLQDSARKEAHFSVSAGGPRRSLRLLCDQLGLRHAPLNNALRVWKEDCGAQVPSASLDSLLLLDGTRRRPLWQCPLPPHWERVSAALLALARDGEDIGPSLVHLLLAMPRHANSHWALLVLRLWREARALQWPDDCALPGDLLRAALRMCSLGHDLYGTLELLHAAAEDRRMGAAPQLTAADWNSACRLAWDCRLAAMPDAAFSAAFSEVLQLMRESGAAADDETVRLLLRFLVLTQPRSQQLQRVLRRLRRLPEQAVSHVECVAVTALLLGRLRGASRSAMRLAAPLYRHENYLLLYPEGLLQLLDGLAGDPALLGEDEAARLREAWGRCHSAEGRDALCCEAERLLKAAAAEQWPDAPREAAAALAGYAAYLVAAHGGQQHRALQLLLTALDTLRGDDEAAAH